MTKPTTPNTEHNLDVILQNALAQGISSSSMLASSIASKVVNDNATLGLVISKIDPSVLANALAKEMVTRSYSIRGQADDYKELVHKSKDLAAEKIATRISEEVANA